MLVDRRRLSILLKLRIEVEATEKLVKVKSHTRVVNGKTVKVRSHYRRIWGAQVISNG